MADLPRRFSGGSDLWDGPLGNSVFFEEFVTAEVPVITTLEFLVIAQSVVYSQTLHASGVPDSWTVVSGSLPTGLTLNGVTGEVYGTPSISGPYDVTIRATNALGQDDQQYLGVVESLTLPPWRGASQILTIYKGDASDRPLQGFMGWWCTGAGCSRTHRRHRWIVHWW